MDNYKTPKDRLSEREPWDFEELDNLTAEQLEALSEWSPSPPLAAPPLVTRTSSNRRAFLGMGIGLLVASAFRRKGNNILASAQQLVRPQVLTLEEELRAIEGASETQIKNVLKGAELREKYKIDWVTTVYTEHPEESAAQCAAMGQSPACGRITRSKTSVHMFDGTVLINPSPYSGDMVNNSKLFSMQDEIEFARIRQFNNYEEWKAGRPQEPTVFERSGPVTP